MFNFDVLSVKAIIELLYKNILKRGNTKLYKKGYQFSDIEDNNI